MKAYLIVSKGPQQGRPIPVSSDIFLVGSDAICQLRGRGLAPEHAVIRMKNNKLFVRDMGSGEATIVNDEVLDSKAEWPLHCGDRLSIGRFDFMVKFREKALAQRDLEEWASRCLDEADRAALDPTADENDVFHAQITNASQAAQSIFEKLNAQKGLLVGRLRIGREANVTVVRFTDRYVVEDSEIAMINQELRQNLLQPEQRVLFDLKHVRKISTQGIALIFEIRRWLRARGSSLALCRVRAEIRSMFATLKAENVPYFADKKAALASIW